MLTLVLTLISSVFILQNYVIASMSNVYDKLTKKAILIGIQMRSKMIIESLSIFSIYKTKKEER